MLSCSRDARCGSRGSSSIVPELRDPTPPGDASDASLVGCPSLVVVVELCDQAVKVGPIHTCGARSGGDVACMGFEQRRQVAALVGAGPALAGCAQGE